MLDATCLDVSEEVFLDGDDLQVKILLYHCKNAKKGGA
jgi:hypothetical protein